MALEDVMDFAYKLWVDDYGAMSDRTKVREAIDQQLEMASVQYISETTTAYSKKAQESLARNQIDLMAMQPPAQKRRPRLVETGS